MILGRNSGLGSMIGTQDAQVGSRRIGLAVKKSEGAATGYTPGHTAGQYGPVPGTGNAGPGLCPIMVAAWIPGWSVFHGMEQSRARCCRNTRSYSSQPRPGWIRDSLTRRRAYASWSRVWRSVVHIAMYAKKQ